MIVTNLTHKWVSWRHYIGTVKWLWYDAYYVCVVFPETWQDRQICPWMFDRYTSWLTFTRSL